VTRSINGTYHAIAPKYLQHYLAVFCYGFNRRFDLQAMISRFIVAAANTLGVYLNWPRLMGNQEFF